jgi:exopolysaccharide biosynthesis protein
MMERLNGAKADIKSWIKENHTLVMFLIAQLIAIGIGGASLIAYYVKMENRVHTMETRGAEYTVARLAKIEERLTILEGMTKSNKDSIDRIVAIMTRDLGKTP